MLERKESSVTFNFIGRIAITIWLLSSLFYFLIYDFYFLSFKSALLRSPHAAVRAALVSSSKSLLLRLRGSVGEECAAGIGESFDVSAV